MTTPAGWYPDGQNSDIVRYWDGEQWTEHTQPVPDASPPPPPPTADSAPGASAPPPPGPAAGAPATSTHQNVSSGGSSFESSVQGITTDLLDDERYSEIGSQNPVALQNSKMLKVTIAGSEVLARQGSMVAFQGSVDFAYEGSGGLGKMLKKVATGEGVPLMRCSGQGEVFLAEDAKDVHILHLANSALTVNGRNVLGFDSNLSWDIERVKGAGMMAGGMFNTRLSGTGWIAVTTKGTPVVLRTDQPTFADPQAAVAWSSNLATSLNSTFKASAMVGRGSGEAFQLAFNGEGIVIVQPAEGDVAPHSHG